MAAKELHFNTDARAALKRGVDQLAEPSRSRSAPRPDVYRKKFALRRSPGWRDGREGNRTVRFGSRTWPKMVRKRDEYSDLLAMYHDGDGDPQPSSAKARTHRRVNDCPQERIDKGVAAVVEDQAHQRSDGCRRRSPVGSISRTTTEIGDLMPRRWRSRQGCVITVKRPGSRDDVESRRMQSTALPLAVLRHHPDKMESVLEDA